MTRDRTPTPEGTPPALASSEPVPAVRARVYEPPAVLWEQPFVALAQVSNKDYACEPGACEDVP
ncbi:hypothetical protein JRI60_26280 [Archangium violaceum]|uniref:hypothetical protein n=1 Tax=Archangium violaceum TaxID=83451 RepID=UPI0019523723|nr:hypothetical protein [Archangium violaceum]QRO02274.1 hypothetical protein JRI60_26280 [Archangium violaceum]